MSKAKDRKNEDVLELLDELDKDNDAPAKRSSESSRAKTSSGKAQGGDDDEDLMGFLDSLAKNPSKNPSRRATPVSSKADSSKVQQGQTDKPTEPASESSTATAAAAAAVNAGAGAGAETGSVGDDHGSAPDPLASISSWWSKNKGGLWDSAMSAAKQAESKVRELRPETEKLQKEGISRLNFGREFLQSALSNVLETIVPPISRHEQLKIHMFHDMVGYPAIDTIVYNVFGRVMQQVEGGGDLKMIAQKGKERHRRGSDAKGYRDLNMFKGTVEQALKLAKANIEEITSQQNKASKAEGDAEGGDQASGRESAEVQVRTSDIFLAIQPAALDDATTGSVVDADATSFYFVIYLSDPSNNIDFSTVSQPLPLEWAQWLDAPDSQFAGFEADPRDWIIDWVEESMSLAVSVIAQRYVIARMGVNNLLATAKDKESKDSKAEAKTESKSSEAASS